jgi:hypothetical protein
VISELDDRLQAERPTPRAAFRGALRRRLISLSAGGVGRPRRLRLLIVAYGATGTALLLVAVAGALGAGPFASG